jgi:hypothetical protein
MRTIAIILLTLLTVKLPAGDLSAPPLLTHEWSIKSQFMGIAPAQLVSTIYRDQLAKTPAWQSGSDYPPLSPRKAEDLALAKLTQVMGSRQWATPDISLKAFDLEQGNTYHPDIRWIYVMQFRFMGIRDNEGGYGNIIVLMDGTVIEPKPVSESHPSDTSLKPAPTAP